MKGYKLSKRANVKGWRTRARYLQGHQNWLAFSSALSTLTAAIIRKTMRGSKK